MWKTFKLDQDLYMIKLNRADTLDFYLTDLKKIWIQNFTPQLLLGNFQDCNPLLDIKVEEAIAEVTNLIEHISNFDHVVISKTEDTVEIDVKYVKSEFNINFKFKLTLGSPEVFLKEVTVPLIQTVKHLEDQQNMLRNLVLKKDRELEEYKLEKGLIARDDLVTEKFDETVLNKTDVKSMMKVFSEQSFWGSFVEQHGSINATVEEVQMDPWNYQPRKRKVFSSKTSIKKGKGINYDKTT